MEVFLAEIFRVFGDDVRLSLIRDDISLWKQSISQTYSGNATSPAIQAAGPISKRAQKRVGDDITSNFPTTMTNEDSSVLKAPMNIWQRS